MAEATQTAASAGPDLLEVKMPRQGLPGWALVGFAGLLGIIVFSLLSGQREAAEADGFRSTATGAAIASPPPFALPFDNAPTDEGRTNLVPPRPRFAASPVIANRPQPPRSPVVPGQTRAAAPLPAGDYVTPPSGTGFADSFPDSRPPVALVPPARPQAPASALVLDRGVRTVPARATDGFTRESGTVGPEAAQVDPPLRPVPARTGSYLLPTGTLIPAVLMSSLDTSRAGPVRALTSRDVRGFDGRQVVVPKGSTLIGDFGAGGVGNADRVIVEWQRLVLPDGRVVRLQFPVTDKYGAPGIKGKVRDNKLGRFAGSVLQSVINAATFGLINRSTNNSVIVGGAGIYPPQIVNEQRNTRRITVAAGTKVNAFVAQDIDFSPPQTNY